MDYVVKARRFIQRAVDADHPEVIKQHLKIADWYLYQEIERETARPIKRHRQRDRRSTPLGRRLPTARTL